MRLAWIAIIGAASTSALAAPHRAAPPPPAELDDPCVDAACSAHAMAGFAAALAAQRAGTADHALRIAWIGDSLTADDHITNPLRARLAALVGNGGPGFVFALPPHPFCQHAAVSRVVGGAWRVHGVSTVQPPDHLLGLGGSAESDGEAAIRLVPAAPVHTADIYYLAQPHGGSLAVLADGKVLETLDTALDYKRASFESVPLPDGAKRIELRARGHVRLFGADLEAARGAVVDNLGVVNATAKSLHGNNLPEHWQHVLAHRAADFVVIMLGTNEAEWLRAKGAGMAEHEQVFGELLASVRAANPHGSCLVISPLDQLDWRTENMPPRASIPAMVDAQRRAAEAHGCAFWDTYRWMGGAGASLGWFKRGLLGKDFQHPTSEGAERIAAALYAALTAPAVSKIDPAKPAPTPPPLRPTSL